ncbi:carboxylesterase family protein [Streptomyces sp. NPDC004296]|uniref:carboxylesterase family protein n=1 Tax=Streptomyces sp. NPDC004296 TaxID=3364697 RepID=UPI00368FFA3E
MAAVYSPSAYGTPAPAWAALNTDRVFACPMLTADRQPARHTATYAYEFADRQAPGLGYPQSPQLPLGAAHATDLPYLFDLGGRPASFTAAQNRLAAHMIDYWTAFARTGAPEPAAVASGARPCHRPLRPAARHRARRNPPRGRRRRTPLPTLAAGLKPKPSCDAPGATGPLKERGLGWPSWCCPSMSASTPASRADCNRTTLRCAAAGAL